MANPVNLTRPRQIAADKVLLDRGTITRDIEGTGDDVYDPVTLEWGPPPDDSIVIAMAVRCKVSHKVRGAGGTTELGNPVVVTEYEVAFEGAEEADDPSLPFLLPGDWIEISSSVYAPDLAGKWLRVVEPSLETITIFQKARASLRWEGPQ